MNRLSKFFGSISILAMSFSAMGNNFFPHQGTDTSHFKNDHGEISAINIVETSGSNWKKYSSYLGQQNQWIWNSESSTAVYWLNLDGEVELLVDFDDPDGTEYAVNIDGCTDYAILERNSSSVSTPAGQFQNIVKLSFRGHCRDFGLLSASFVEGVGLVQWQTDSLVGPNYHKLTRATIDGVDYPLISGLQILSEIESGVFDLSEKSTAFAYLRLENGSDSPVELTFLSGQRFEIEIVSDTGEILNRWSNDKYFTQMVESITLEPGSITRFGDVIDLTTRDGFPLHNGDYRLRISLKGFDASWQSGGSQNTFMIESPFKVAH